MAMVLALVIKNGQRAVNTLSAGFFATAVVAR